MQRFGYDAANHQKEFFASTNGGNTPDAIDQYDGEGHRVRKVAGSEVTIFVYDANGLLSAEYSTTIASTLDAKVSYITADHLGSPRIVTDRDGVVVSREDFTAFGETVSSSQRTGGPTGRDYDTPTVRQDYTGYEKDGESQLEFAQARYYNTQHGRFTSVDPLPGSATIRNPQTLNRYSYVLNSPYKFTDPLGLFPMGGGGCGRGRCHSIPGDNWWSENAPYEISGKAADEELDQQAQQTQSTAETGTQLLALAPSPPPDDPRYNCMAWTLGITDEWIQPNYSPADGRELPGFVVIENRTLEGGSGDKKVLPTTVSIPDFVTPHFTMTDIAKYYGAKKSVEVKGKEKEKSRQVDASATSEIVDGQYKIVVFETKKVTGSHAMRQDADGTWSSKNGVGELVKGIEDPEAYYAQRSVIYN